jgi:hypothetical protein
MALFLFLGIGSIALFSFLAVASWSDSRRREREAYYRSEAIKKVAELQSTGGANSALELLREEDRLEKQRRREGQKLGGLVTLGVGIGIMVFLRGITGANHDPEPVYLAGLIPALIGVALLAYAYLLAPDS